MALESFGAMSTMTETLTSMSRMIHCRITCSGTTGDKTFTESGLPLGVALSGDGREQAGMGVDFGDYDNDGDLDLIVTNSSDDYDTLIATRKDTSPMFPTKHGLARQHGRTLPGVSNSLT
jgi:hypothetical protein